MVSILYATLATLPTLGFGALALLSKLFVCSENSQKISEAKV
jgi:hypothetical protein